MLKLIKKILRLQASDLRLVPGRTYITRSGEIKTVVGEVEPGSYHDMIGWKYIDDKGDFYYPNGTVIKNYQDRRDLVQSV